MGVNAEQVLDRFRQVLRADQEAGRVQALESYQRLFHGFDELIAEEFVRVIAGNDPPSAPAASQKPISSAKALLEKLSKGERPRYTRRGEIARGGMGAIMKIRDEVSPPTGARPRPAGAATSRGQ